MIVYCTITGSNCYSSHNTALNFREYTIFGYVPSIIDSSTLQNYDDEPCADIRHFGCSLGYELKRSPPFLVGIQEKIVFIQIICGIFLIMHSVVHLLYSGQSARRFELQPGMVWPNDSWAFSRILGNDQTRKLASGILILAAAGFAISGIGIILDQDWARLVVAIVAVFSGLIYTLLWDGSLEDLASKGGVGVLIDIAILVTVAIT